MSRKLKILVDILMALMLLFLMAYSLIGNKTHEIIGIVMFFLFVSHQILNRRWYGGLLKGRYHGMRVLTTGINGLLFILMIIQMASGILLSKHLFTAIDVNTNITMTRLVHLAVPYWLFLLTSLHLGFHWRMVIAPLCRKVSQGRIKKWIFRCVAASISGYGIYAFVKRSFAGYMFLKNQYAFFDFREPLLFFLLDYIAVMGLFVFAGHYLISGILSKNNARKAGNHEN